MGNGNFNVVGSRVGAVCDCVGAIMSLLRVVLNVADAEEDARYSVHFDAGAILNARHTFEDALDAAVQLFTLPEDNAPPVSARNLRADYALRCCWFIAAYLLEIDTWDRLPYHPSTWSGAPLSDASKTHSPPLLLRAVYHQYSTAVWFVIYNRHALLVIGTPYYCLIRRSAHI